MNEKRWYVVNTYSGHEDKVKEKLLMRTDTMGMQDYIFDVVVPTEKVIETRNGKEKEVEKKLFPGYILVEMIMSDDAWYVVRNTPGVTGFIGSSGKGAKPTPLQEDEVDRILQKPKQTVHEIAKEIKVGAKIRMISGAFEGMEGEVLEINDNNKLLLSIDLFGVPAEVESDMSQIELI